jgi:menaquinone-dependent protoporphyrinogen oxidase
MLTGDGSTYLFLPGFITDPIHYPFRNIMGARILVAYATRNGSTAEIAQAIGKELTNAGLTVDVAEIKTVSTLADYSAIVTGGPLYMGSVDGAVGKFVEKNCEQLQKLPVAAFVVGLAPKNPDPGATKMAMDALKKSLGPVTPLVSALFAGKLDPIKLSFIQRKMTELVKSPVGDFRDWDAIAAWARELPEKMGLFPAPKD